MKELILVVCAGVFFTLASANAELCNYDGSQSQMNYCAKLEFNAADAFLNRVWAITTKCIGKNSSAYKNLLKEQLVWIKETPKACKQSADKDWYGGSGWPLAYYGCMNTATDMRTVELMEKFPDCEFLID